MATPVTAIRIPTELKQAAVEKARAEDPPRTLTDVVVAGLTEYVGEAADVHDG